jgi:hypothetical protein
MLVLTKNANTIMKKQSNSILNSMKPCITLLFVYIYREITLMLMCGSKKVYKFNPKNKIIFLFIIKSQKNWHKFMKKINISIEHTISYVLNHDISTLFYHILFEKPLDLLQYYFKK